MSPGARARIRLDALEHNLKFLRNASPGAKIMSVIKANAYGHGLVEVAKALNESDALAVARLSEAKRLRDAGINMPLVSLGGALTSTEIHEAADLGVQLCVHTAQHIEWLEQSSVAPIDAWLKIDTGMNRLGVSPADAGVSIDRLQNARGAASVALMTHLANADDVADQRNREQLECFAMIADEFSGDISLSNSAAILGKSFITDAFAAARSDGRLWNRPGLALYGIWPLPGQTGIDSGLRPVMQFETVLMAVKQVTAGDCVGYGSTWRADTDTKIGVVATGYGDGYSRAIAPDTPILINDRRVPVIGRISMDTCTVNLGANSKDNAGDLAVLWGESISVEEIAACASTIPYTLVTGVTERVERVFEN